MRRGGTSWSQTPLRGLALVSLLFLPNSPAFAQPAALAPSREFVTPETRKAIDEGLEFLAARQHPDGSFGSGSIYERNVAVTSLCGMAFLAGGHTPGRGKYGANVQRAVDFVLSRCQPNGFITDDTSDSHGPMYGHGFATLFLAEVYGMSPRRDLREKLALATRLIVNTQNAEGGWRYFPEPKEADISVTACQMMALRAARNCGIHVPKETVDRCVDYVKQCQNVDDGGFRYRLERGESGFPRSAAGTVALFNAGLTMQDSKEIQRAVDYLARHVPRGTVFRYEQHYFYGHYYAIQAMWQTGEKNAHWREWYPAIRDELLDRRLRSGGWSAEHVCPEYGTAMACLVLQMPYNYLPIFQH